MQSSVQGDASMMTNKFAPLEQYLRGLPSGQEDVTVTFALIEQMLKEALPELAYAERSWWGNQQQGTYVESIAWMDAGWLVDTVDLREKWVKFVRQ
jgi:hypothetical protein